MRTYHVEMLFFGKLITCKVTASTKEEAKLKVLKQLEFTKIEHGDKEYKDMDDLFKKFGINS